MFKQIAARMNCSGSPKRGRSGSGSPKMTPSKKQPLFGKKKTAILDEPSVFEKDVTKWGEYDFKFTFKVQGQSQATDNESSSIALQKSVFLASILNAEAEEPGQSGYNLPIQCTWYRQNQKLPEVSGNVYQLSAKDIGCTIRCEAESLDTNYTGKALAEYGPVKLDIYARNFLEQNIGAGAVRFPINLVQKQTSVSYNDQKEEAFNADLYLSPDVLSITLKDDIDDDKLKGKDLGDTLSFKFNINYPRIDLHPYDTKKLTIFYNEDENVNQNSKVDFFSSKMTSGAQRGEIQTYDRCLEITAHSRETRDLIALSIKCFATINIFNDAAVQNLEEDQDKCNKIVKESKLPHLNTEGFRKTAKIKAKKFKQGLDQKEKWKYPYVDVLLEMDFCKHDLNQQIRQVKTEEIECTKFKKQFYEVESTMAVTIDSHKNQIEKYQSGDMTAEEGLNDESKEITKRRDDLQTLCNELEQEQKQLNFENEKYDTSILNLEAHQDKLNIDLEMAREQCGVPKKQIDECKKEQKKNNEEIKQLKKQIQTDQKEVGQNDAELNKANVMVDDIQRQLKEKEEDVDKKDQEYEQLDMKCTRLHEENQRDQKIINLNQTNSQVFQAQTTKLTSEEVMKMKELEDQYTILAAQTKSIQKGKEALGKELQQLLKDKDKVTAKSKKKIKELNEKIKQEKIELDEQVETLTNANERLQTMADEQNFGVQKLETEMQAIENKFYGVEPKETKEIEIQVDVYHWLVSKSDQTEPVILKEQACETDIPVYMNGETTDETVDEDENGKSQFQLFLENENQQCVEEINEKENLIAILKKELKSKQMKMKVIQAQQAEKDGTITQLKEVEKQKEDTITEMQQQTAKNTERLANAEMQLFEMQDMFTDDGSRSMARSQVSKASRAMSNHAFGASILTTSKQDANLQVPKQDAKK